MKYPIITVPNEILRTKCRSVDLKNEKNDAKNIVKDLILAMRKYDGIGLSAPQIGKQLRIITVEYQPEEIDEEDLPFPLHVMINPVIKKESKETSIYTEGCLSLPNLEVEISRPASITVYYQDIEGKNISLTADGLLARAIQHEVDHLNGIIFTDYINPKDINLNFEALSKLKYGFISSSDIAVPLLEKLADSAMRPDIIITETAKPCGRGLKIRSNPIAIAGNKLNIPVIETDNKEKTTEILKKFKLDSCLIFAFGQILPQEAIDDVKYGIYNVHPSLLPKLRGATPIQTALLHGETKTGITLMQISSKIDEGNIVNQTVLNIDKNDHCRELWQKVAHKTAEFIPNTYAKSLTGQSESLPQAGEVTYTEKFDFNELAIKPNFNPEKIYRLVKACNCGKRPFIIVNNTRIILDHVDYDGEHLILKKIQVEGKKIASPGTLSPELVKGLQKFSKMIIW